MRSKAAAEVLRPDPMTLEAWSEMDEDEPGELVDGLLVEEELPSNLHELVVGWLIEVLRGWAKPRKALVFGSEHKLAVAEKRGRKPDVCVYAPGKRLGARASLSRTAPDLIVEVISPRARDVRRDRMDKVDEYGRFGVRWYWLLDPETRLLEILELGPDGRYLHARTASEGVVEVPGFEGLALNLSDLWEEADSALMDDAEENAAESGEG